MLFALLMMACSEPPPPPAPEVSAPSVAAEAAEVVTPEDLAAVSKRLDGLEDRLARLELLMAEMQEGGRMQANEVTYDPSRTTLAARNAQDALTELYKELDALQRVVSRGSMGQAGDGLFQLPREGARGPANPQGGHGGAPTPPPIVPMGDGGSSKK